MLATKAFFVLLLVSVCMGVNAQQCGNCKEVPSVALFGFDVQVPQPNVADSTDKLWLEWKNLFILAGSVGTHLKQAEGNCIKITTPPSYDKADGQELSVGGERFVNLPSNPNISPNLSVYGSYLMTGTVKKSGTDYLLHVEIQSSCSRKVITTADVPFQLSTVAGNVSQLALQAVQQLSPLAEKIKAFELEERKTNRSLSLFQTSWGAPLKVAPQKKTLKAGESTDVTIELKDCDGVPLAGREILFNETTFEGMKIFGTTGGTVSPAKIVTDANGIAKAKFTLKAGAREAVISAHSPGNHVKGCSSMFIGDAAINIKKSYAGYVQYSMDQADQCVEQSQSATTTHSTKWDNQFKVQYVSSFYLDETGYGEDDSKPATDIPDVMESGNMILKKHQVTNIKVANNPPTQQLITKKQGGGLKSGSLTFSFGNGVPSANLSLKFALEGTSTFQQTYLTTANNQASEEYLHDVSFLHGDPNLKYEKAMINGKVKHILTYYRVQSLKCTHVVERFQLHVTEE